MACKSLSLLVLLVIATLLSASIPNEAASSDNVGLQPLLDPKDPRALQIAVFAVKEHNKEAKTALKLRSVFYAEENRNVGDLGEEYELGITAADNGAANPKKYRVVVRSSAIDNILRLISFEPI